MKLPIPLSFDWDRGNVDKNWIRHEVYFREAEEIFLNNPLMIFPDTKHSLKEKRYQALGMTNKQRKLSVFFTLRNDMVRIISARDQNRKEVERYVKKET
jgi:uncharacterized protein